MSLTPFQEEFKKALSKIKINEKLHSFPVFYAGVWECAQTDEKRKTIISGIKSRKIRNYNDVVNALR